MSKISIVIPVYNVEKYLRECLNSVINQTLQDIEIICIDDGSTDSSLQILQEYAQNDSRINIIKNYNQGVAISRNIGINEAKGEYICFIDSDDYYPSSDVLEILYKNAKEQNVFICGGELAEFNNDDYKLKQEFSKEQRGFLFEKNELIRYIDYQFDYGFYRFIYNSEFIKTNNIYFPNYKRFEDPPFMVKAMILAEKFYAVHKIVYAYRTKYKTVNWTEKAIIDSLKGIMDDFVFAKQYNLTLLKEYSYARLESHLKKFKNKKYISLYFMLIKYFFSVSYVRNMWIKKIIKNLIKNLFSITNSNNKTHKIITILGIKISLKRKSK